MRESVLAAVGPGKPVSEPVVLGILSLIIWALLLVVTAKYVLILLRADNNGEGGTLALMALASRALGGSRGGGIVILLGIISGALFYGDAIITPALSVLSADRRPEGRNAGLRRLRGADHGGDPDRAVFGAVARHRQGRRATSGRSRWFGSPPSPPPGFGISGKIPPCCWRSIRTTASTSCSTTASSRLFTLGAVFLVVTGSEALYADLGHFGRGPIRFAWLVVVLPALTINYLGQGALVLADPKAIENPFFLLYPHWALLPMVALATAATVIASQAVITGAYSLTQQAIQLGLLPRLEIRHTSEALFGQIYMPRVNTLLLIGVLLLVALFRSSSALASAYGIAVTGTMVVTAMMAIVVIWRVWRWRLIWALALMLPFLLIDFTFLAANLLKIVEGGWMPLALGAVVMAVMYTWRRGSRLLFEKTRTPGNAARISGRQPGEEAAACACPAPPCSSPAIRPARRPR